MLLLIENMYFFSDWVFTNLLNDDIKKKRSVVCVYVDVLNEAIHKVSVGNKKKTFSYLHIFRRRKKNTHTRAILIVILPKGLSKHLLRSVFEQNRDLATNPSCLG